MELIFGAWYGHFNLLIKGHQHLKSKLFIDVNMSELSCSLHAVQQLLDNAFIFEAENVRNYLKIEMAHRLISFSQVNFGHCTLNSLRSNNMIKALL